MRPLLRFLKYNNAFPVAVSFLLLSFGGAMAASPEVRDGVGNAIVGETTKVLSIDNTYIANKDLLGYTPSVQITAVTEDQDSYYVSYTLATIDVVEYVWKDVREERTMSVAKAQLSGKDLGLYVTEQLKQVIDSEVAYLREVQEIERKQVSQKVVATAYSGLVGAFLEDKTEALPGYQPVMSEPSSAQAPSADGQVAGASTQAPQSGSTVASNGSGDTTPPTIQILGANPASIFVGSSYSDLGAAVTDNVNQNLGYTVAVDGVSMTEVAIDTRTEGTHTVRYTAEDQAGNSAYAERLVEVIYDPSRPRPQTGTPSVPPADSATSATTSVSTTTP